MNQKSLSQKNNILKKTHAHTHTLTGHSYTCTPPDHWIWHIYCTACYTDVTYMSGLKQIKQSLSCIRRENVQTKERQKLKVCTPFRSLRGLQHKDQSSLHKWVGLGLTIILIPSRISDINICYAVSFRSSGSYCNSTAYRKHRKPGSCMAEQTEQKSLWLVYSDNTH